MDDLGRLLVVSFGVINPLMTLVTFPSLTRGMIRGTQAATAALASMVAFGIVAAFAFAGDDVLRFLQVSLASFRIAGGLVLGLAAVNLIQRGEPAPPAGLRFPSPETSRRTESRVETMSARLERGGKMMRRSRATSVVLWAMAIYTALAGLLFTGLQGLAATIFRTPVRDPRSLFGLGVALLTIAALKAVMAGEPPRYRTMVGIILASEAVFALWQLYEWLLRGWTGVAVTGLIDAAFTVLLAVYFPKPYLFRVAEAP